MPRYKKDFLQGKNAEKFVMDIFQKNNVICKANLSKIRKELIGWDFAFLYEQLNLAKIEYKIEVKNDIMEQETGNIAIEYYNTKLCKSSGIDATIANFWVYVLENPKTAWISSVKLIKEYIKNNLPIKDVCGGDDNSQMKIYPREQIFSAIFNRIDNLDIVQFKELLNHVCFST